MLNKLFGSQARVKLLKAFLVRPENKFYIRQLARDLKLQVNSVRRELENLERFGLLTSKDVNFEENDNSPKREDFLVQTIEDIKRVKKRKGAGKKAVVLKSDKKYFQVNKDFVLFEEIKALILKAQMLYEKDFVEKLYKIGTLKLMILTGFFVANSEAPIDLLIVGRLNKTKLNKTIAEMEAELGREINFTALNVQEFIYRRDITDVFLYGILEGKKITIIDEFSK